MQGQFVVLIEKETAQWWFSCIPNQDHLYGKRQHRSDITVNFEITFTEKHRILAKDILPLFSIRAGYMLK